MASECVVTARFRVVHACLELQARAEDLKHAPDVQVVSKGVKEPAGDKQVRVGGVFGVLGLKMSRFDAVFVCFDTCVLTDRVAHTRGSREVPEKLESLREMTGCV